MKYRFSLLFSIFFLSFFTTKGQLTWEHSSGPEGGTTRDIIANETYAFYSDLYFTYRTSDGESWEQLPEGGFFPLATFGDNLVGDQYQGGNYHLFEPKKLKLSKDNGETWVEINKPTNENISDLAYCSHGIYINNRNALDSIYRSTDEGVTWEQIAIPTQYYREFLVFEDRLYLYGSFDIWRTDTNGENWEKLSVVLQNREFVHDVLVFDNNILIASEGKLSYSTDDGQTWNSHVTTWPDDFDNFANVEGVVYADGGSTGLSRSFNFGETWEELTSSTYDWSGYAMGSVNGKLLGADYNKGILTYDIDLNEIREANTGLWSGAIYELTHEGNKLWAGTGTGVFSYDLTNKIWNKTNLPVPRNQYPIVKTGDNGLVVASQIFGYGFHISQDFGATWQFIEPTNTPFGIFSMDHLAIIDNKLFASSEFNGLLVSDDLGQTWEIANAPFLARNLLKFKDQYYASSFDGLSSSTDGLTWNSSSDFPSGVTVVDLSVVEDKLFVVAEERIGNQYWMKLYVSDDAVNWQNKSAGLPSVYSDPIQEANYFITKRNGIYFAYVYDVGFYVSTDNLETWIPYHYKLHQKVERVGDDFYIGSFGGGVLRTEIPTSIQSQLFSGKVYYDKNKNNIFDSGEPVLSQIPVSAREIGRWNPFHSTLTDDSGNYNLAVNSNIKDTVSAIIQSDYFLDINPPYYLTGTTGVDKNFAVQLESDIVDLCAFGQYLGRPRPGFDLKMQFNYTNAGTVSESGKLILTLDPKVNFLNSKPTPDEIVGNTLKWDFSNLNVLQKEKIDLNINVPVDVALGELVKSTFKIETDRPDIKIDNNEYIVCDTVVGSYDPNDKMVVPAEGLTEEEILEGKEIFYTVRFQNTGTFHAEKVRITDQLDTALFLPSLRLVAASHDITSFKLSKGGLMEVVFDNIFLPDSTANEPESHGFVTIAIQRKKAFNPNRAIENFAEIYFDFNEPIITNTVSFTVRSEGVTSISEPKSKENSNSLLIFPNPTKTGFTVKLNQKLRTKGNLTVFDESGKLVFRQKIKDVGESVFINADNFSRGVYIVHLSTPESNFTGKVILN